MELTLLNDIFESRMFSSRTSAKRYSVEDIANMAFLDFLAIQILKSEFDTAPIASNYLYQTFKNGTFDRLLNGATDLYWMIHLLMGKDLELIDQTETNMLELEKISIDEMSMKTWARQAIKGKTNESLDRRFLMSLERMLNIRNSDYKSTRLLISSWNDLNEEQKQLAMTRLLFAMRKRMPRSELLPHIENLSKSKKLEIHGAKNPEHEDVEPTKGSLVKKLAIAAAVGAAIALPIAGGVKRYREFKHKIDAIPTHRVREEKEDISENASASCTAASSVASVVQPMTTVSRTPRVKHGDRKKKSGVK